MSGTIAKRLAGLGLVLPSPVSPLGNYVTGVRSGDLVIFSAHGPLRKNGMPSFRGRVGIDFTIEEASGIAIGATLNVLASAQQLLGDLDAIECVPKICAYVTCTNEVMDPSAVCEPAFALLTKLFGQPPAATVVPAVSLPNNVPVFMELIAKVRVGVAADRTLLES